MLTGCLQRIEPFGWDTEDRIYFLLDDDRLYRRTDPPIPEPPEKKAKAKPKKSKSTRSSKRRKLSTPLTESGLDEDEEEDAVDEGAPEVVQPTDSADADTFGGMKWECIAVTLKEYQAVIESLKGSRDVNDKQLRKRLVDDVLPVMLGKAEEQARKEARRVRERENEMKLLSAKRSSRIATKLDKKKEEEAAAEAERKRREDVAMARKLEQRAQKAEQVSRLSVLWAPTILTDAGPRVTYDDTRATSTRARSQAHLARGGATEA